MSKKKEAGERTLDDVMAELNAYEELKREAKERIESQIDSHREDIRKLENKLVELGFGPAPSAGTKTRKAREPRADGEKSQRLCSRCSLPGHRFSTCTNEPTAEWLASDRGKAFEAKKG
jgi:hypothetical protein